MANGYYKPCRELDRCNELIDKYWTSGQYAQCFAGHLTLAEQGYPLAECQVCYFYLEGLGVEKDPAKAFYWTSRAAAHGDWDGQYNLACFYADGTGTDCSPQLAARWYRQAALQGHELAIAECEKRGIRL